MTCQYADMGEKSLMPVKITHDFIADEHLKENPYVTVWQPCNIYPTAKIGEDVSIGMFSEIGPNVVIGDRVRIGAGSFIPEGVTIESDVFIGPRVTFANDRWPPSDKKNWEKTLVKKHAVIGAGCCILPGVVIGENARLGMGSTLTKNIPDNEVWYGNPAKKGMRDE